MPEISVPAPLWRRLAASCYDGLLLLAIWMATAVVEEIVRDTLLHRPRSFRALQVYLFCTGLAFFGWFWTHGGQTLGMRVWHLQLRREDGAMLRWPVAVLRYAAMLLCWGVVIFPALSRLPHVAALSIAPQATAICIGLTALSLLLYFLDGQRRAPQDFIAGTVVMTLPKNSGEAESAHPREPVDRGAAEQ
ncbi:MAG: RDD family protein [Stenotrophobium sp.]